MLIPSQALSWTTRGGAPFWPGLEQLWGHEEFTKACDGKKSGGCASASRVLQMHKHGGETVWITRVMLLAKAQRRDSMGRAVANLSVV